MSQWIVKDAVELRRRGRYEFVAIDIGEGYYNVRGPSIDGRGYDRHVRADVVAWVVEDLNAAMAVGRRVDPAARSEA